MDIALQLHAGDVRRSPQPARAARTARAGAHKLLVGFRLYRDGRAELQSALHVPGEVPPYPPKSPTGITLELLDAGGSLLATIDCGRSADRHGTAPYEDFQVAMLWHEQAQHLVAVQDGREIARWEIEQPVRERIAANLTCRRQARDNGEHVWRVGWSAARRENVAFTLRFTPDDGKTWLAVAAGVRGTEVDVDESGLPAGPKCRFQLLTSTGFRTIAEESEEVFLSPRQRQIAIVEPGNEAEVSPDGGLWLSGIAASLLGEARQTCRCLLVVQPRWLHRKRLVGPCAALSPGRHVLTLTVDDGSGGELTARVTVHVRQGQSAPAQTTYAGARH